jgi:hypothetical protein
MPELALAFVSYTTLRDTTRCRRLAKDWEKSIASAEAWINVAHIRLTTRRLARFLYL